MKFYRKILDNGLTVLFEKRDVDVTTVMLGVRYGYAYDSLEEKGVAHFIEHLCFKGTEKRNVREIASEVERLGGDLNAFTGDEITAYHVKIPSNHLSVAMDVIFDVFFNPVFPEEDIEKEASVICEEIKMYKDNPIRYSIEKIKENLYEEPFGCTGLGRAEVIKGMTREMLKNKHLDIYVPNNSILSVVGNNDFDEIVSLAEKFSFGVDRKNKDVLKIPKIILRNEKNSEFRNNLQQSNVVLGFHFPWACDKNRYAAEIFSSILGNGMSSRLFSEVREKRGLAYSVKTDLDLGRDYGYFIVWAGCDPCNVEEVKKICLEEFYKMKNLTEEELVVAKIQVIGNWKVEKEGSRDAATDLIISEIHGGASGYYEYEDNINRVSLNDIRELAEIKDFASFSLGPKV